jgi:tRNA pseudouridine55 synthase
MADGIIIINKSKGCTSHDIVYKMKKLFNEKVGHTGTLDPMAEGVLPILVGKGTLCSKYLINHDKKYVVTLQLGKKTDTADSEGKVIDEKEVKKECLEQENIEDVLKSLIGKQEQIPPIYSAIKLNGKKLYEYARKGQEVEIKPRQIEIYNITLLEINKTEKQVKFEVYCGKGTYIRSLCEDIATRLQTVGYMKTLQRTEVGSFKLEDSITIEQIQENPKVVNDKFLSIESLFIDKDIINLSEKKLTLFLNGVKLTQEKSDDVYRVYSDKKFIGIGIVKDKLLKRDIIIEK